MENRIDIPKLPGYKIIEEVGKTKKHYDRAYLAANEQDTKFLVRSFDFTEASDEAISQLSQEIEALRRVKHSNIIRYISAFGDAHRFYLITGHYDPLASLYSRIKEQKSLGQFYDEQTVIVWLSQIASAIDYLHSRNIMHRNIKSQNVFFGNDRTTILKIGNFAISRILEPENELATTIVGTPYYMAPEFFLQIPYDCKADIWSLGCILFEIATLRHAFQARNVMALGARICQGDVPRMPDRYSQDLNDLASIMLAQKPSERPSASTILKMPIVRQNLKKYFSENQQMIAMLPEVFSFCELPVNETARINWRKKRSEVKFPDANLPVQTSTQQTRMLTIPSGINALVDWNKLSRRISQLHEECLKGLGLEKFHHAWQIMVQAIELEQQKKDDSFDTEDFDNNTVENELRGYLGEKDFGVFATKLIDLKFCEDLKERRLFGGRKDMEIKFLHLMLSGSYFGQTNNK